MTDDDRAPWYSESISTRHLALDASKIVVTLERLYTRISERFPRSGLTLVCGDLAKVARRTAERARRLARPYKSLRLAVWAFAIAGLAAQVSAALFLRINRLDTEAGSLIQGLEAAVNLLILFGATVWFLMSLEERLKRSRVLAALHELRSFAHIVDMHQLTKDPTIILDGAKRTASSPVRDMSEFELTRYLDYCAEMLALIGKLAALYAENVRDTVVVTAVNDIETLTSSLARKIWQKIMILGQLDERKAGRATAPGLDHTQREPPLQRPVGISSPP